MIPIKDTIPRRTYPFVTLFIIVVNGIAFLFELSCRNSTGKPPAREAGAHRGVHHGAEVQGAETKAALEGGSRGDKECKIPLCDRAEAPDLL
jgi:hypothetical protein